MDGQQPPGPSEKERLQAHYNDMDRQLPPTPSSAHSPSLSTSSAHNYSTLIPVGDDAESSGFHDINRDPTPPPYSGPSSSSQVNVSQPQYQQQHPRGAERYPGLPRLNYKLYSPPLFDLSADCTSIVSKAPYLSSTVSALVSLVRAQSTVPPKPQIHITGNRGRKVDFAVKLNLMSLLVPDDPKQRMDYIRCVDAGEMVLRGGTKPTLEPNVENGGLEEWCRRFVEDAGPVKCFVLERVVANMDVNWLEGQIRSLVAATNYKGVVTVSFPVTHAKVVVQNPDKVNKFFTGITTLFSGKRTYEVVKAVWPFATHKNGEQGRRCIVQSEETWWREWRDPIKYAIATKRKGWVTNEDKLEAIMEGKGKGVSNVDWGPDTD